MTPLNAKQLEARRSGMAERAAALMELHFPGVPDAWLWQRKKASGFATVPRTLPIVMEAIDNDSKGQPGGHTLFCLWARAPDGPMLVIENPATFAAEAGFTGARAVDTWRRRMKWLRDNTFLMTKPGPSGDFHYVLLLNPNAAVEWMRGNGKVQTELYGRFRDRLASVGAAKEIDAIQALWTEQQVVADAAAAAAVATGAASATGQVVPPPTVEKTAKKKADRKSATATP